MSLKSFTARLIARDSLSEAEVDDAMTQILHGGLNPLEIAAFLVAARATDCDHTPEFIAATVRNLLKEAHTFTINSTESYSDIVGTGGDGQNTFNVSTTSAIVASGAGVHVAKHGGPASTSTTGASDLLNSLDVNLSKVNANTTPQLLESCPFVYMSGPIFHPMLASIKSIRKKLGVPTIFNLVGPLLNPAPISARVLGVYTPTLGRTYAEAAAKLFPGMPALVVCGEDKLDEISTHGSTRVWELRNNEIKEYSIIPADFGLIEHSLDDVRSGTPQENAQTVYQLLNGELPEGHPIRDYVLLNTSALLYITGKAATFKEGVALANESIESGRAAKSLATFKHAVDEL